MLAACRRALGQPSHYAFRGLSTLEASASHPLVRDIARHAGSGPLPASASAHGLGANQIVTLQKSSRDPLYLEMSSLIPPEDGMDPSTELVELDPTVFNHPIRRDILHLCVIHYLDGQRQGSASTKTRGEVRGSGAKIRPQKGTGRARLGDAQSPMLRGGGVAFGPKPRDFSTKLNRKVLQMGMRIALSARVKEHSLGVVKSLDWQGSKTRDLATRIEELGWGRTVLVTGREEIPRMLKLSAGNLSDFVTVTAKELDV